MKTILQILTRPQDPLPEQARLTAEPGDYCFEIIDLTKGEPDYDALLEAVFCADRIQVW